MTTSRKRKLPEVRRQEILDAAVSLGAERGLESVSIRDVAERAAVAPGLIHHYFPSLDALLTESFGSWADAMLRQLREQSEGVSPRMAMALIVANLYSDQRIWNDALSTAARVGQLRDRARDLSVEYLDHVETLIHRGVADGSFTCADPTTTAWRIILMLDGLVAMIHVLEMIKPEEIATIVGPVVEEQLALERGTFTELVQAVTASTTFRP